MNVSYDILTAILFRFIYDMYSYVYKREYIVIERIGGGGSGDGGWR